jgi:hypothetical protein
MENDAVYEEKLTSPRTQALFLALALVFLLLSTWRFTNRGIDLLVIFAFALFCFFSFYFLNYRALVILLDPESLLLQFGVFRWKVSRENIEDCYLDETSLWRIGGAGIHFSPIEGRYRAMFNFLEYPRLVIRLKERRGLVKDIAFSTRHPGEIMARIQQAR